jgi:hypothetical protein
VKVSDNMPEGKVAEVKGVVEKARQGALAKVVFFPLFMLACYLGLIAYFKSRGGYRPVDAATGGH